MKSSSIQGTFFNISGEELMQMISKCVEESLERNMEKMSPPSPTKIEKMYVSLKDIEEISGYKYDTLYKKHKAGQMPPCLPGNRIKFKSTEILEWIESGMPEDWNEYQIAKRAKEFLEKRG